MPVNNVKGWAGWSFFGALLLVVQGAAQLIMGISELGQKKLFFVLPSNVISHDTLVVWGWIAVVLGVLLLAAGFSSLHNSMWAKVAGAFFAGLALLANLVFLPVYPLWAVVAAVVSAVTLYSLVVRSE